jgi:hypothetical protein
MICYICKGELSENFDARPKNDFANEIIFCDGKSGEIA